MNVLFNFEKWLSNSEDYETTKEVFENLDYNNCPKELVELKDYITKKVIFSIGGDG